jgi:two-component system sensor kinase FixL
VGYDDQWTDVGDERVAHYTGLPPRAYRFEAFAYDVKEERRGEAAVITMTVAPLWWQTWWFRVAMLVGVLASSWGLLRHRMRTLENRRRAIQDHRDRLAQLGRLAAMGELTAALSHELNQPLGAIRSNAEAATRFLVAEEPDLEEVREILSDIVRDDQRAANVIQRVRSMVTGRPFRSEALDITSVVQEVVSLLRTDASRRGVSIACRFDEDLPPIKGDRVQLEQVLLNLLMNGLDAVEDWPVRRLSVEAAAVDGGFLQVSVRDSGPGTRGKSLDTLFESFVTTKSDGMGMGLAISRSIVEAHGGRIWATENPDSGLTFHFTIPCAV